MPAPIHNPDGSESLWCYTRPSELYGELRDAFGHFPLQHFWGPMADIWQRRRGSPSRRCWVAGSGVRTSSTSICRTSTTPLSGRVPRANRPARPWPIWTASWAEWLDDMCGTFAAEELLVAGRE